MATDDKIQVVIEGSGEVVYLAPDTVVTWPAKSRHATTYRLDSFGERPRTTEGDPFTLHDGREARLEGWKDEALRLRSRADLAEHKVSMLAAEVTAGLERERDLRAKLAIVATDTEVVWRWQGDGHDHEGSLTCPVVMSADTLRGFVAERDEARAWVRRLTATERVLTCAFCGEAYPPGTPESNHDALAAHVKVCPKHPMREVERENQIIASAARALLESLGEYVRQTMTSNREWRAGVLAVEAALHGRRERMFAAGVAPVDVLASEQLTTEQRERLIEARAVSAERDRRVLLALRDHLLQHPEARAVVHAYVVERWNAADLSEGMAAYLLGVDRLTAREIADGINAAKAERASKLTPTETYAATTERRRLAWAAFDAANPDLVGKRCHANRDGDCVWPTCPQNRDGEPKNSGRHCPLDRYEDE